MHRVEYVLEYLLWNENKYFWGFYSIIIEYDEMNLIGLIEIGKGKILSKFITTCVPTSICFQLAQFWHYHQHHHEASLEHYVVLQGFYQAVTRQVHGQANL